MSLLEKHSLPPGRWDGRGLEWVCSICPACGGKQKLYFNPQMKMGVCFGGGCGVRLHGWEELEDLYEGRLANLYFMAARVGGSVQGGLSMVVPGDPWAHAPSREFLESRGITQAVARATPMGLHKNKELTTVIDPLSPEYSPEVYTRNSDGAGKWIPSRSGVERKNYAFGWAACRKQFLGREVVIAEGLFDILAKGLIGRGVAIMGTDFPEGLAIEMRSLDMRGVLFFDPDPAGDKARKVGMEMMRGWGVECRIFPVSKDPKEMTQEEIHSFL